MTFKKCISLLLCLCMLVTTVSLFASCQKEEGDVEASGDTISVDLTSYILTYSDELTKSTKEEACLIANQLRAATGLTNIRGWEDKEDEPVETDTHEILVGKVNRVEVLQALDQIKGSGWIICVINTKIVIVGTTPMLTKLALSHFAATYVNNTAIQGTTLTIDRETKVSDAATVSMSAKTVSQYALVYGDTVDDVAKEPNTTKTDKTTGEKVPYYDYSIDANPLGGDTVDYTYTFCESVRDLLIERLGGKAEDFVLQAESDTPAAHEILVGNMSRPEYKAELDKLEANQYGFAIRNGKMMLLAWNDVTLKLTTTLLEEALNASKQQDGSYLLPADCMLVATATKAQLGVQWAVDFPKPEGENIRLDGTADVGTGSLEYIYTGTGVNAAAYQTYCSKLEEAGYTAIMKNQNGNDIYRTYVNAAAKIVLHVYLSTYTYAAQYTIPDVLPSIRVVAASRTNVEVPDEAVLSSAVYDNSTWTEVKAGATQITQLKLDYAEGSFGNAYFFTLADGSFVLYDGGRGLGTDVDAMWDALEAMHTKVHGSAPSEQNPIHVRGWFLSHEHGDHFTTMRQFLYKYGKESNFKMDGLYFNPISASERVNSHNPETAIQTKISTIQGYVTGGFDFIKIHTGQVFYFENLKIEVLYTHEDAYPKRMEYFNNSSSILRSTLKIGKGATQTQSTMIWLGDSERIGGRNICAMYGPTLDSDMVQVAHHGWNGVEVLTYELIAPEVVWWPVVATNFDNLLNNNYKATAPTWYYAVNYAIGNTLSSVKLIMCADYYNFTMSVTGTAADYDYRNLTDLVGNNPITARTIAQTRTGSTKNDNKTYLVNKYNV